MGQGRVHLLAALAEGKGSLFGKSELSEIWEPFGWKTVCPCFPFSCFCICIFCTYQLPFRASVISVYPCIHLQLLFAEICPEMHALAKMGEMAINRQNRQTINKNSNEMAKGPFGKWRLRRKWRIWWKWQKWQLIATLPHYKQKFKWDGKGALWKVAISTKMAYLTKMAEMALIRQNCQSVNKNSNEVVKGPFGKWRFWRKWRIWRIWQKWQLIA